MMLHHIGCCQPGGTGQTQWSLPAVEQAAPGFRACRIDAQYVVCNDIGVLGARRAQKRLESIWQPCVVGVEARDPCTPCESSCAVPSGACASVLRLVIHVEPTVAMGELECDVEC